MNGMRYHPRTQRCCDILKSDAVRHCFQVKNFQLGTKKHLTEEFILDVTFETLVNKVND